MLCRRRRPGYTLNAKSLDSCTGKIPPTFITRKRPELILEGFAMRLAKKLRQQLLDQNEGFETSTHYSSKNFTEDRHYQIAGGELHIRSTGKTS